MRHSILIADREYRSLNPVIFGYEDCEPNHAFGPAVRQYWLIHFVTEGFGRYEIHGKSYRVGPGEIFVIPPYEETFYQADEKQPWRYTWIGFTSDEELPARLSDTVYCPNALAVFNEMKACAQMNGGRSAFLCARLWDLFALLSEKEEGEEEKDYLDYALDCIHSEYMNDITMEQIARRLNLDRTYFSAVFKKKIGLSPRQYLIRHRMTVAAELMVKNRKSVSVAALSVGYPDIFSFSKMFKKHFGVSPNEYVKQKR